MKIIKFLFSNFQILNFFIASLIVVIGFSLWYSQSSSELTINPPEQKNQISTANKTNTELETSKIEEIKKQPISLNSKVEVSSTVSPEQNQNRINSATPLNINSNNSNKPQLPSFPCLLYTSPSPRDS